MHGDDAGAGCVVEHDEVVVVTHAVVFQEASLDEGEGEGTRQGLTGLVSLGYVGISPIHFVDEKDGYEEVLRIYRGGQLSLKALDGNEVMRMLTPELLPLHSFYMSRRKPLG